MGWRPSETRGTWAAWAMPPDSRIGRSRVLVSPSSRHTRFTAGPIAVAGVMGGLETEIDGTTRNILLESANFDFISIRRTTQALKLPSEASLRFGKGIHPALAESGARRASESARSTTATMSTSV